MSILSLLVSSPRPLEELFIEEESKLGGTLFSADGTNPTSRRFWYFQGDWYFEQQYQNQGSYVIRYQILENSMHKLFHGREVPFSYGEEQVLVQAIKRYHSIVSEKLYGESLSLALAA